MTPRRSVQVERLLIIKPSSLGDVLHALPAFHALRDLYPRARIAWLVNRAWAEVLDGQPGLDAVVPFDRRRWGRPSRFPEVVSFVRQLRAQAYDLVVDLQGLFRSGALAALTGAPIRVGFADGREGSPLFYTQRVPVPPGPVHAVEKNLLLPRALGWHGEAHRVRLQLAPEDRGAARSLVADDPRPRIALHPVTTRVTKQWPIHQFAALASMLKTRLRAVVYVTGSEADRAALAAWPEAFDGAERLTGRTSLRQLAALFEAVDCVVTNDSGPMHLAAAVGTPVVAVFGSTDPARTGPYGNGHRIIRRPLWCSPCSDFARRCWNVWTPLACLRAIEADEVFTVVVEQLEAPTLDMMRQDAT